MMPQDAAEDGYFYLESEPMTTPPVSLGVGSEPGAWMYGNSSTCGSRRLGKFISRRPSLEKKAFCKEMPSPALPRFVEMPKSSRAGESALCRRINTDEKPVPAAAADFVHTF